MRNRKPQKDSPLMRPLEWSTLRSISNSAFAKLAILVPFLPFLIEFARTVVSPIFVLGGAADHAKSQWGIENQAISLMIDGLEKWATENLSAVISFYVGITFFLIAKFIFQLTAPRALKNDDFEDRLKTILNMAKLAHDANNTVLCKRYNKRAMQLYDASNGSEIFRTESDSRSARWILTILFGFSVSLLIWPPVYKFLNIFLGDFLF